MPELPEVETIRQDLARHILRCSIQKIIVYDRRVIRNKTLKNFTDRLMRKTIAAVHRRGKALIFELEKKFGFLVVQPMMTGQLVYSKEEFRASATKVRFQLSNGHYLHYNDSRLFGRLQMVADLSELKYFRSIGPEPLSSEFTCEGFKKSLKPRSVPIKALLMEHSFVAGIGNIYASEILFQGGIHPNRTARSLNDQEITTLYQAIIKVLKEAVRARGTSFRSYRDGHGQEGRYSKKLMVYGRERANCFSCARPINKIILRGRSTFFCPNCQK
jgi:formamidopyrimidine-DNA glycosylase